MSFALDSIVVFVFILIPGIAFRRFYFQGPFIKQYNSKTLAHSLTSSIFPGIIIQLSTLWVFQSFLLKLSGDSISSFYNDITTNKLPKQIFNTEFLGVLLLYLLIMLLISWLLAEVCYRVVTITKLDKRWSILRFKNHWHYHFRGELKGFRYYKDIINGNVVEVRSDVLLNSNEDEPRLYSGIVRNYTTNEKYDLELLYLSRVSVYKKNKISGERVLKEIPGDLMVISSKDILNINFKFITTPKKIKDFRALLGLIFILLLGYILLTQNDYFSSNTLFKTILLKIFFIIFLTFTATLLDLILHKSKTENKTKRTIFFTIVFMSIVYYLLRFIVF